MQGWFGIQNSVRVTHACSGAQSCLTLGNPMDSSLPSSFVHGILQARILEEVAISFSRGSSTGIESMSPVSPALAGGFFTTELPRNLTTG